MTTHCRTCAPAVEIKESENGYTINMELPGSSREDIKVWQENGFLTITGEKKKIDGEKLISERIYGKFSRSFKLPRNVDHEKIEANYKNGVVTVEIAKTESAKPKEITVN